MIHLQMNGFIADNLFQYVVARVLAEELGFALRVSHSRMHPQRNVPQLEALLAAFADAPLSLQGAVYEEPVDHAAHMDYGDFDGYDLDLAALCDRREPRRLEVKGYFQRYDLLRPYKARMRSWFALSSCDRGYAVGPDDLVVHIRRGDLLVFNLALSLDYYRELLKQLSWRRLYIVGCGLDGEVRRYFARFEPVYVEGEPLQDLQFMLAFDRMILSNSGFAWWAGFLSTAREVHFPAMSRDSARDHPKATLVDLRIDDESRFHYVENVPYQERAYTLADVYRARGQLRKQRVAGAVLALLARRLGRLR